MLDACILSILFQTRTIKALTLFLVQFTIELGIWLTTIPIQELNYSNREILLYLKNYTLNKKSELIQVF